MKNGLSAGLLVIVLLIMNLISITVMSIGVKNNKVADVTRFSDQRGWPVVINGTVIGPPVLDDVDNDGKIEIVLGSKSGNIYVFKYNGTLMDHWPVNLGEEVGGIPSLGDVNNDNFLEIIDDADNKKTYVLSKNGEVLPGWPVVEGTHIFVGRPSVADINNDNYPDIIMTGCDSFTYASYIFAYNRTGQWLSGNWPFSSNNTPFEGMQAVGDINGDGYVEIVTGASYNGGLYAIDHNGNILDGWPVEQGKRFPAPITLADLDKDGDLEIIGSSDVGYFNLYIYHHNGTKALEIENGNGLYDEIVPIDLDGDQDLEILTITGGQVNAFHHTGERVNGWPVFFEGAPGGGGGSENGEPSVIVGDINGDAKSEILMSSIISTEKKFKIYAWYCNGSLVENFPMEVVDTNGFVGNGALALGDLDGDGSVELVLVAYGQSQGIFKTKIHVIDLNATYHQGTMTWPQFHHDAQHTGVYCKIPDTTPPEVTIIKPKKALYINNKEMIHLPFTCRIIGSIDIAVNASDNISGINRVEFYIDTKYQGNDSIAPYYWTWEKWAFLKHTIKVIAYDYAGNSANDEITVWKFF